MMSRLRLRSALLGRVETTLGAVRPILIFPTLEQKVSVVPS